MDIRDSSRIHFTDDRGEIAHRLEGALAMCMLNVAGMKSCQAASDLQATDETRLLAQSGMPSRS
jgi:hypothetical protein